jgi:hypothetical protein
VWVPKALAVRLLAAVVTLAACSPSPEVTSGAPTASSERFPATTWNFDRDTVGGLPVGATMFTGKWAVRAEAGTPSAPNALCQTASAEFPAIQLADEVHADMAVSTQFKPISGRTDEAAGVLLRIQDPRNYYIVRANALEGNVVIFKYVNGQRSEIKSGSATVASGVWQRLRGEVVGTTLRGYLGDKVVVESRDTTFREGRAGLWTKADSVTCFDDVVLGPVGSS